VEAARYLPWAALTAVAGVLAFQMDGVFIGATWSRDMRNMMLLSFLLYLAALLTFGPGLRQSRPVGGAARLPDGARPQPARHPAVSGAPDLSGLNQFGGPAPREPVSRSSQRATARLFAVENGRHAAKDRRPAGDGPP
jgi:hypothetical protein